MCMRACVADAEAEGGGAYLRGRVLLQVAGLALLAGVSVQAEDALLQRHLQLLSVGVGVVLGGGVQFFLQHTQLHQQQQES